MENSHGGVSYQDFATIQKDITDMKTLMSQMVNAMNRITVIEERQQVAADAINKAVVRMELISDKQHVFEIEGARNGPIANRVDAIEKAFLEMHVEDERNKARFHTVVWLVRGLWAVVGSAGVLWFFKLAAMYAHSPVVTLIK